MEQGPMKPNDSKFDAKRFIGWKDHPSRDDGFVAQNCRAVSRDRNRRWVTDISPQGREPRPPRRTLRGYFMQRAIMVHATDWCEIRCKTVHSSRINGPARVARSDRLKRVRTWP